MDWFSARFNTQPFIIFDEAHDIAGVSHNGAWTLVKSDSLTLPEETTDEALMADAWKRFYDAVSIKDRYNPELHRSFMPKRLWDNITEMQERIPAQLVAQTVAAIAATSFLAPAICGHKHQMP